MTHVLSSFSSRVYFEKIPMVLNEVRPSFFWLAAAAAAMHVEFDPGNG